MRLKLLLLPLCGLALSGQISPPDRNPEPVVATSRALEPIVRALAQHYEESGGSHLKVAPVGSDVAMASLTTGKAELALIGRSAFDQEAKAYEWVYGKPPAATVLFSGSLATPGLSPALAFRVSERNPLKAISLEQIRKAFAQREETLTWRSLGVGFPSGDAPVRLIIPNAQSGTGRFLRAAALGGQVQFPWRRVTEISPEGFDDAPLGRIARAVRDDPAAIAASDAAPFTGTRILAVVVDGKPLLPGDPGYPFERSIIAWTDRSPSPEIEGFLRFLLTDEAASIAGQAGVRPRSASR